MGLNKPEDGILIQWKMVYFINIADTIDHSFGIVYQRIAQYLVSLGHDGINGAHGHLE